MSWLRLTLAALICAAPMWSLGRDVQQPSPPGAGAAKSVELLPDPEAEPQPDSGLSLLDFEGMAFANNPTLAAAAARMQMARGRLLQAGLYPNPVVGYHAVEIGLRDTAGQQGAFLTQRLMTGGKLRLDQEIAGRQVDEAGFRLAAQEQRVLSDVRVRFYHALVAQQRLELTEELAEIGAELATATEKLIEARQAAENDLLQAEIKADEALILFENAQNHQVETWRRLAAVSGVPEMRTTALDGELDAILPDYDWQTCYARVLGSHPQIQEARTRVERTSIAMRRARREPIPNLDLSVSVRHHNVSQDEVANVQLGLPIPIFDRNQGNIRRAEAAWIAASNELKRIELDLQDRLAVAYRRFANARQQVDRYRQRMIPRARRSLQLVTNGYEQGQVDYLTLLTAQQTYLRVNLSYLDALRELWASSALIDGRLLSESLIDRR